MVTDSSGIGRLFIQTIFLYLCIFFSGCDGTIDPVSDEGTSYSIYGVLNIENTPNFIRVHDNSALFTPESTKDLDATILITDLETGVTTQLRDSVVRFDSIYTHNFVYEEPIRFDNRYKIVLENNEGYRDSLVSVTPLETDITLDTDAVECDEIFTVQLTNIDLNAGEELIAEAGIQLSNTWYWSERESVRAYDSETHTLTVGWSPDDVSFQIFAGGLPNRDYPGCEEFTSDMSRVRITHVGYMEGGLRYDDPFVEPDGDIRIGRKIVLGKYVREAEVEILPETD